MIPSPGQLALPEPIGFMAHEKKNVKYFPMTWILRLL